MNQGTLIVRARRAICHGCPDRIPIVSVCSNCGCPIGSKTWFLGNECPKGYWGATSRQDLKTDLKEALDIANKLIEVKEVEDGR